MHHFLQTGAKSREAQKNDTFERKYALYMNGMILIGENYGKI